MRTNIVSLAVCALGASAGVAGAQPSIFFTDTSADTINTIGADGTSQSTLVSGFGTNLNGITVAQNQVFWTDLGADMVFSAGTDGSNPGTFLDLTVLSGTIFPGDITNDGQNVYFSDGPFEERLYSSPASSPSINQIASNIDIDGLEADPNAGKLFMFDFNEVFSINFDGSNLQTIIGGRSGIDALTVDPSSGDVFFLEDGLIATANGDGSGLAAVLDLSTVPGYGTSFGNDIAFFDGSLYWIEAGDSDGIWTLDLGNVAAGPTQVLAQGQLGNLTVIPAPSAAALMGLAGLAAARRRRT